MTDFNKWALIAPDQSQSIYFISDLEKEQWMIGKCGKCDIKLSGDFIHKKHLQLKRFGTNIFANAVKKDFPVFLNGLPLIKKQKLNHGDKIVLGTVKLFYSQKNHEMNKKLPEFKNYAIGLFLALCLISLNDWYNLSVFDKSLTSADEFGSKPHSEQAYAAFNKMSQAYGSLIFFGLANSEKQDSLANIFISTSICHDIFVAEKIGSSMLPSKLFKAPFYKTLDPAIAPKQEDVEKGFRLYSDLFQNRKEKQSKAEFVRLVTEFPFLKPLEKHFFKSLN